MKNPKLITKQPARDQSGIVSILIVSILAIIMSLVAIGFSHLSNRELRQALDRELQSQAFFAAEAGLNDARAYLAAGGTGFSGCANWPAAPVNGNNYFVTDLSGGSGVVKYSCISIDNTPQTLSYSLNAGESKVIKLSSANLSNLYIGWENQTYSNAGPSALGVFHNLPREQGLSADATGLLRVGIYRVPQGDTSDTNDNLAKGSRTYFLYPNFAAGAPGFVSYGSGGFTTAGGPSGNNGSFVQGNCQAPNRPNPVPANKQAIPSYCNSEIGGLDDSTYYLYITARYAPLWVRFQGTDSTNKPITFDSTQAVIDVTGKGTDQLQRIRARVDLSNQYKWPGAAVQSMESICKDFSLDITALGQYGGATVLDPSDPACQAPSGNGPIDPTAGVTHH